MTARLLPTGTALALLTVGQAATAATVAAEDTVRERIGIAYAVDDGELLYRELHRSRWQDGRPLSETVIYRDADGRRIARKTIDYRESLQAPAFHLVMEAAGYEEGLAETEDGLQAFVKRPGEAVAVRLLTVERSELVADAGFDRVIRRELARIAAGGTLEFRFLVPSRLKSYAFRVREVGETEMLGEPALHLRFEPAGLFMRWLADPIDVWYRRGTGRLLRYVGPSNLREADGSNARVRVDFPDGAEPAPASAPSAATEREGQPP